MSGAGGSGASGVAGGVVGRVDGPWPGLLAIGLRRRPPPTVLLLGYGDGSRGVGLVEDRPRGRPADGLVQSLRRHLVGARWEGLDAVSGGWDVAFERGGVRLLLGIRHEGAERGCWLARDGRVVVVRGPWRLGEVPPPADPQLRVPRVPPDLEEAGRLLLRRRFEQRRAALRRAVKRSLGRLDRRLQRLAEDAARAEGAEALQREGELLLAHAHASIEPGGWVTVTDWYVDPPARRRLPVDERLGVVGSAERRFHEARRARRAGEMAEQRRRVTLEERARWLRRLEAIERARDHATLEHLEAELGLSEDFASVQKNGRDRSSRRAAWRVVVGHGGRRILVGRGGRDNEELTFRHAGPHDLWLHVRGVPGAHVVVPMRRDEVPPSELLLDAATLAAHFSALRGEQRVEVQYTRRKYVRPIPGGRPGMVRIERERTLLLEMDSERVERLLRP